MNVARVSLILANITFRDWRFRVGPMGEGVFLQPIFEAADNEGGPLSVQRGRKWYVSAHATEGEVVQTALKAILTAFEHEAREQFHYKGKAIFGPHFTLDALLAIADQHEHREPALA